MAQATGGVPRLLNQAATRAFRLAAANGQTQVDAEAAVEALAALGLGEVLEPAPELARGLLVPNSSLLADDGLAYSSSAVVVQQPGRPPCLIYAPARSA